MPKTCPICRETHDATRGLSYDTHGINSCGIYRSRLATFTPDAPKEILGPLFEVAPELLDLLTESLVYVEDNLDSTHFKKGVVKSLSQRIRAAIEKVDCPSRNG